MNYTKNDIINAIKEIRIEIGHEDIDIHISNIIWENNNIWIITPDRSDKSAIIGKGGWVVGKLREKMGFNQVHVEAESDFMIKRFKMELAFERVNEVLAKIYNSNTDNGLAKPLENLEALLEKRMTNIYNFSFINYINYINEINDIKNKNNGETNNRIINDNKDVKTIVALSGGVDSSYSLIVAKYLGFNPIAITVDPGTIVLPKHLKYNIENLCSKLNVEHHY
ncbi:MAG: ATPase, partial [Methanobacteriaceae archaeon]